MYGLGLFVELEDGLRSGEAVLGRFFCDSQGDNRLAMSLRRRPYGRRKNVVRATECIDVSFPGVGEILRNIRSDNTNIGNILGRSDFPAIFVRLKPTCQRVCPFPIS
jgi:hypothetical protein